MKKSIIIWILLGILAAILLFMPAFSQNIPPTKATFKLGLVSDLVKIKSQSENKMARILALTDTTNGRKVTKELLAKRVEAIDAYNVARMQVDRVIIQLTMDLTLRNRVGIVRRINRFYRKNSMFSEKISSMCLKKKYTNALKLIQGDVNYFLNTGFLGEKPEIVIDRKKGKEWLLVNKESSQAVNTEISPEVAGGILETLSTIVGEQIERNGKKTDKTIAILNELRWKSPDDIGTAKKEEKKEKKESEK